MTSFKVHKDKPDSNLEEIRQAAHDIGALTYRVRFVDLVVVFRGEVALWEVKTKDGRLREEQVLLHNDMMHKGYCPKVIRSVDDVVEALGSMGHGMDSALKMP